MSYNAIDFRYDAFSQTITAFAIGYTPNPKEVHVIPASAPYEVHLNEIPRGDSPSTLLINIQAGADFEEVSFSTPPSAGQFRAVYGSDIVPPVSIVGQGTVQFNSADAGKTVECAYYGLGAIIQNQFFNQLIAGEFGVPDKVARAINYAGSTQMYTKTDDIGDWNMAVTAGGGVASIVLSQPSFSYQKIRGVFVRIRDDSGGLATTTSLDFSGSIGTTGGAGTPLTLVIGGAFDSFAYDATSYNRGWITYLYEE